jgi:lipopolysaccharide biosynthesis glycosyltransferase
VRVASAVDENYAWPYMVLLTQAKIEATPSTVFALYYLRGHLSAKAQGVICDLAHALQISFEIVELDPDPAWFKNGTLSETTFARFPIIENENKVLLYLDVDLLLRKGWGGVFQEADKLSTPLEEVASKHRPHMLSAIVYQYGPIPHDKSNKAFLKCGDNYFNAGVMILNPERIKSLEGWREKDFLIQNYTRFGFQLSDQCVLNYILHGTTLPLSAKWNYMGFEGSSSHTEPLIVHFAGTNKPWNIISSNKNPYVLEWKLHQRTLFRTLASEKLFLRALPLVLKSYLNNFDPKRLLVEWFRFSARKLSGYLYKGLKCGFHRLKQVCPPRKTQS